MSDEGLIHLKNGEIVDPEGAKEDNFSSRDDLLLAGGKIVDRAPDLNIQLSSKKNIQRIDAEGKLVLPGFIDSHVHLAGGGGEDGFHSRTPPLKLSQAVAGGVTTLVGCLGTDATTRSLADLLARARALKEEGLTSYIYTGSYQFPVRTLTGAIDDDIIFINEIIGLGEVAIADHRSSHPTLDRFKRAASQSRRGGMLAGKSGVVNIHMGSGRGGFKFLRRAVDSGEIPISQFLPTHVNRSQEVLKEGIKFAEQGGWLDFTTSGSLSSPGGGDGADLLLKLADAGLDFSRITFSSDGQGSLPSFDDEGNPVGFEVGQITSLYEQIKRAVKRGNFDLSRVLSLITINPARILGLEENKGALKPGNDADIVLVDEDSLSITGVTARGEILMREEEFLVKGTFE